MEIYLNDSFVDESRALISVRDRGFRFGDGVFESIPCYYATPYQWEFHIQRLFDGMEALRIPARPEGLRDICNELIRRNGMQNGVLRIAISRGVGSQGYLPDVKTPPTIVIETVPFPPKPEEPATLWLSPQEKISAKALPVEYKTAQGLASTLARMEARDHKCVDALMMNANGKVTEVSSGNIFWLKDETLHTPSLSCGLLRGATRHAIIRLSPYPVKESIYPIEALEDAEAVIICNAALPVLAVNALLPVEFTWESVSLAQQLRALLDEDIYRECKLDTPAL